MRTASFSLSSLVIITCALHLNCGGAPPPAPAAPVSVVARQAAPRVRVRQEFGSLDPEAMDRAFEARVPEMQQCMEPAFERLEVLAGKMSYALRVREDGHAKYAYFTESTLGDREAEKCILQLFMKSQWPASMDGESVAKHSSVFDQDVGDRVEKWAPAKVQHVLRGTKRFSKCAQSGQGKWELTAYIAKDTSTGNGKLVSAGGAHSEPDGGESLDCLLGELHDVKFPAPTADFAKVTFSYPF